MASIPPPQSLVGLTVYHFASGEFGEELVDSALRPDTGPQTQGKKIKALLHHGLVARGAK